MKNELETFQSYNCWDKNGTLVVLAVYEDEAFVRYPNKDNKTAIIKLDTIRRYKSVYYKDLKKGDELYLSGKQVTICRLNNNEKYIVDKEWNLHRLEHDSDYACYYVKVTD